MTSVSVFCVYHGCAIVFVCVLLVGVGLEGRIQTLSQSLNNSREISLNNSRIPSQQFPDLNG
jgi:hypothetical protein